VSMCRGTQIILITLDEFNIDLSIQLSKEVGRRGKFAADKYDLKAF
jgi:hypothetical protein